jgi:isopentenyl phosphate kinase
MEINKPPIRILKIGGSLLTARGAPFQVAHDNLARIAAEVAGAADVPLVIIHGLGSFGRAVLPLYDGDHIAAGRSHLARRVLGLLAELNANVVDALDAAGVPVSPMDAGTLFALGGRAQPIVAVDTVRAHLAGGRVPILHGGTLLTTRGFFAMMSSDKMTLELARVLRPDATIWATDVDGVLDQAGALMPRVSQQDVSRMWHPASVAADPSGAMHGKVAETLRLAAEGVPSLIVNGMRAGRIEAALRGAKVEGTSIRAAPPGGNPEADSGHQANPSFASARWQTDLIAGNHLKEGSSMAMPMSSSGEASSGRRPYKETCMPTPELFLGPRIERLNYRVFEDVTASVEALKRGEVDLVDFPLPGSSEGLPESIAVDPCRDFGYYFVGFNTRRGPLSSRPLRKAIAYLLDDVKKSVAGAMTEDRVELMDSIMVEYYGRLVNRYLPSYQTDDPQRAIGMARDLLAGASVADVADGTVRCLVTEDDPIAKSIMANLRSLVEQLPELARICTFVELPRNEIAAQVYAGDAGDWDVFCGWQYVQDNLSRWNPGMSKLRLSLDWVADFQSRNSRTRNYVGYSNSEYDAVAEKFLTTLHPRDLRGAVITEEHLEPWWNNAEFWADGGNVPDSADALLLLWKLQWMIAEDVPVVPLFARTVRFVRSSEVTGVWNGDPGEHFTYPGGSRPIASTYPGGTLSYWTFQRVRRDDSEEINLAVSNKLRHLNPLGVGNYWDALVWSRLYESMLGLNPFLLMKGVAEDAVNLADSFTSEIFQHGKIRYGLHFAVKPGVRWHDGTDFTARDVAFTYLSMLGARGRELAAVHGSTKELLEALVNDEPIPAWVDMTRWLEHVEVPDDKTISLYFTHSSRYIHEWFGDMPIVPMHVWRHLGPDFTRPSYNGAEGLYAVSDAGRGAPHDGFSGWHGLVGTGPFMWTATEDPLGEGGSLIAFPHYHNRLER